MKEWNKLANEERVNETRAALERNGIQTFFVRNGAEAKEKVLAIIPKGEEVMNNSSTTMDTIGVSKEIMESGEYNSVRKKLMSMDRKVQGREMQSLGSAPQWSIGSTHAVTEKGEVFIASQSGSQLPSYAYGAGHVIWVVGTQKIVKDSEDAIKRIYEHCLPLESERAKKVYGTGSAVNKVLRINREAQNGRITLIFVNEVLGF